MFNTVTIYQENATGALYTPAEARKIFRDEYDGGDPFNGIPFDEYFTPYTIPIDEARELFNQ